MRQKKPLPVTLGDVRTAATIAGEILRTPAVAAPALSSTAVE
jgi:hypothetical protein